MPKDTLIGSRKRSWREFANLVAKYGTEAVFNTAKELGEHMADLDVGGGAEGAAAIKTRGMDDILDRLDFADLKKRLEMEYGEDKHEYMKLGKLWPGMKTQTLE
jgi:hypothetical protein